MLDVPNIPQRRCRWSTSTSPSTGNYITARCHDANKQLNIKGKFTYSDGQSDTAGSSKACQVG